MREKHYPIRVNHVGLRIEYTYKCDVCGHDVSGYHHKAIYGKVLCGVCRNQYVRDAARFNRMPESVKKIRLGAICEYKDKVSEMLEYSGFMTEQVKMVMEQEFKKINGD